MSSGGDAPCPATLGDLGVRICIMGPSGSGKSTLATAIGRAIGCPVVHLDRLRHLPHTDWQMRPNDAFAALHDAAVREERWVMDGNYAALLPRRLARATGLILLDIPMRVSLWRYLRRSWFEPNRKGALDGGRDSVKWAMIRHIATTGRANRARYSRMIDATPLPTVRLDRPEKLAAFYRDNRLFR